MDITRNQALPGMVMILIMMIDTTATSAPIYGIQREINNSSTSEELIVVLNNHTCNFTRIKENWRERFASGYRYKFNKEYRFGKFAAAKLTVNDETLKSLAKDPEVKYIEINRKIFADQTQPPDPCGNLIEGNCMQQRTGTSLWGLSRISSENLPFSAFTKYTYLSDDGAGVNVYVIDTGIFPNHAEFEGRAKAAFVSTELSSEGLIDQHGHGTHVSGTIAGKTYGVAKKANIIGVKVLGAEGVGTLAGLLEGLEWVHRDFQAKKRVSPDKAKGVVNLSLGGSPGKIQSLDEATITLILESGLPVIVAAGNENIDACLTSPAHISSAIKVGASNQQDVMSSFSNYGRCVDILAPGEMILSADKGSTTASVVLSGTSMATPHVTGVVARFLSQSYLGTPSPADVKAWLLGSSTKNALNMQEKPSTPNRLLHMLCLAGKIKVTQHAA